MKVKTMLKCITCCWRRGQPADGWHSPPLRSISWQNRTAPEGTRWVYITGFMNVTTFGLNILTQPKQFPVDSPVTQQPDIRSPLAANTSLSSCTVGHSYLCCPCTSLSRSESASVTHAAPSDRDSPPLPYKRMTMASTSVTKTESKVH